MVAPLIEVKLGDARGAYRAGEELSGTAWVTTTDGDKLGVIELSVLWQTEGKGTTDTGVVFFESFPATGETERRIPFRVRLPLLPLSYNGELIKIQWVVRARCLGFLGDDTVSDTIFVMQ